MYKPKKIPDFRDYKIDSHGNVWSFKYNKKRRLKNNINLYGYCYVILINECSRKALQVHRLVAKAFIPNPKNKKTVNHIDGNKQNNNINNLEWNTHKENNAHSYTHLERKPAMLGKNGHNKLRKRIGQYSLIGDLIKKWESAREAERSGYNRGNIIASCLQKIKRHRTFIWRYL